MKWNELSPEPRIKKALDHAGPRPESGSQNEKRRWSERFADGCAVAIAQELRTFDVLRRKAVRPDTLESGTEPLTPLGAQTSKRIDVTVADRILGLELGFSLKGHNFSDGPKNYDKNLTGRLYEMGDEMRMVHEHLPHAFMVGVLFFPIDSTKDKPKGNSSFANAVLKLRSRTGRIDATLPGQAQKCDAGFVGLYATGNDSLPYPRGVVRFFDVNENPPQRGRPQVPLTLSFTEFVSRAIDRATEESRTEWSAPEQD